MVTPTLRKKMWRDLWGLRTQTMATAILIICGVALLVAEWSAYRSLQTTRDTYYSEYKFADIFSEFKRASIEPISRIAKIPGVQLAQPRLTSEGLVNLAKKSEPAVGKFISVPSGLQPALNLLHLRKGRLPVDSSLVEIVVHEGFALANGIVPGDELGIIVQGLSERVQVVGIGISPEYVYALSPSAPLPDDLHFGVFWLSEKSLKRLLKMEDGFNSLVVKVDPTFSKKEIITAIDTILKPYGSLGAYARDRQISNMFVEDEISQQRVSSIFIPAIFLSIAAFLINIISSRLISLHRGQIAALKAVGYSRTEVSIHYLELIFAMTIVGTLPGLAAGAWLGSWMSSTYESYFRFPELRFSISPAATMIGLVAGIVPGLVGAFASIRFAFKIAPAEAMRPAAPPAFHASLLEKMQLQQRLTTTGKMVFRNLLFRPFRLILVVLSISAAIAIVVAAGSWSDMIDYLLHTQFQRLQREDISLSLIRPRSTEVLQETSQLPGVIFVEGFRTAPVRIKYLNHKRELQLTGWPDDAKTRQLLSTEMKTIPLPPTGILLSRFFEKKWGMKQGDLIHVEFLEGTSKSFDIRVADFSDELIGISANMQIQQLWKLLGEERGYNLINIKADPKRLSELYVQLKNRPEIASVVLKNALYLGFKNSFGKVIHNSTLVLMVASLLIALGIIYNTVRVSFSERAWELASLRVLGFEQSDVTQILLLEVGVQVLLSLIPGCFLGLGLTHLSMRLIHTETMAFPVVVEAATYARGLLAIILAFILSSYIVYQMTVRLKPAEALKARE